MPRIVEREVCDQLTAGERIGAWESLLAGKSLDRAEQQQMNRLAILAFGGTAPGGIKGIGRYPDAGVRVGHQQALRLAPDDRNSHLNLGTALVTLGRHEEAIPHYRRAIELRPDAVDTPQLLNAIGVSFESLGQPEEAGRFYRRALEIAPGFTEAHENLTRVLK